MFKKNSQTKLKALYHIVDIFYKKDCMFVNLKVINEKKQVSYELSDLINNENILSELTVKDLKSLFEFYFNDINKKSKRMISWNKKGILVYSQNVKKLYQLNELKTLIEDDNIIPLLEPSDAYLLGKIVGENKLMRAQSI